ncbi:MAG: hypothetical protein HDT21_03580 [Ruminococcus sp.]|nr:hypothetical protein [Ruminococcus sp.]
MKHIFKLIWKIYNLLVNIFGHICVLALIVAFGYYLHTKNLLYLVLLSIIGILILILVILCINASIAKRKLKAVTFDTNNLEKSAKKLNENIKK